MNKIDIKTPAKEPITQAMWESAKNKFESDLIGGLFSEPAELLIADIPGSAYWFWCVSSHQIRVCANAIDNVVTVPNAKNLPLLLQRLIRHECSHAVYSCRLKPGGDVDLIGLRGYLNAEGVGMTIWNLAEDCWIEHKDRTDNGYRYNWRKWVAPTLPEDYSTVPLADRDGEHAAEILFDIKVADGHRATLQTYLDEKSLSGGGWKTNPGGNNSKRVRVYRFYRELLNSTTNSWEVADLVREFCKAFPEAASPPPLIESYVVPGTLDGCLGGDPTGENWSDIKDSTGNHNAATQSGGVDPTKLACKYPKNFRAAPVTLWAKDCGKMAYDALKKGLKNGTLPGGRTISPTANLDVKDFLQGKPDCYRKNIKSAIGKGQRVEVVYDLSGSMVGQFHEDGIRLLDALKRLHDEKEIALRITWVSSTCLVQWGGDEFRASDLRFVYPDGGSPLGRGFNKILPDVDKNTLVIGYTDGAVDHSGYDKADWLKVGVRPCGAYVTDNVDRMNSESMAAIFEQYEVSGDVASCAKGLGAKLKRIRAAQS